MSNCSRLNTELGATLVKQKNKLNTKSINF